MPHPLSKDQNSESPIKKSTSNPDLHVDSEVEQLARGLDRTSSMRTGGVMDVSYYSTSPYQRILHEEIALQWVVSSGQVKDLAMSNSWLVKIFIHSLRCFINIFTGFYLS